MRLAVAGLMACAVVLAGCSATVTGSGTSSTAQPPTAWTLTEAQQHYLDYVAAGNHDIDIVNRLVCTCTTNLDPDVLATACAAVAHDDQLLGQDLASGAWPQNATSAISALISVNRRQQAGYQACADATTLSAMLTMERNIVATTAQATAVRRALDLPPPGPAVMAPLTSSPAVVA
jgi:hypothetical protein